MYNLKRPDPPKDVIHQVDRNRDFLASMGIRDTSQELFFGIGEEDRTFAESYFKETFEPDDCVIGLLPCGSWPSKKCDPVKLAEFGDALLDTFDTKLLLIWGPEEEHEAQAIREFMSHQLVLPPLTSIREMGALLEKCSFVVANDSGPMHISVAVGTPVISLQGPTDPRVQGPYGRSNEGVRLDSLDCIGCHRHVCPKSHECFMDMPAERVIEAAERIIERNNLAIRRKDRK